MSVLYLHICFLCVLLVTDYYTVRVETIKSMLVYQQDVYMAEQICNVFELLTVYLNLKIFFYQSETSIKDMFCSLKVCPVYIKLCS